MPGEDATLQGVAGNGYSSGLTGILVLQSAAESGQRWVEELLVARDDQGCPRHLSLCCRGEAIGNCRDAVKAVTDPDTEAGASGGREQRRRKRHGPRIGPA
jgi:hypothetical protein